MNDLKSLARAPWKPNLSESLVKQLVVQLYGLEVTHIKNMVSFNDQNFYITVSGKHENPHLQEISEDGYTFKIINTKKSGMKEHFSSMHSALLHLNQKGLHVPLPITNLEKCTWKIEEVPLLDDVSSEGSTSVVKGKCGIHVLKYMPGVPVSSINWTENILFDCGLLLAKFHDAMKDLVCPDLYEKQIMSALHHMTVLATIPNMEEEFQKIIDETLKEFENKVAPQIQNLPKGFLHGDFNDYNILAQKEVDREEDHTVYGILDFEDVHWGAYIWDVGLMMAHLLMDTKAEDPIEDIGIALAGYISLRPLKKVEMAVLKTCIECRLCQSLVFCAFSRDLNPSNEYIHSFSLDQRRDLFNQMRKCTDSDLLAKWESTRRKCFSKRNISSAADVDEQ